MKDLALSSEQFSPHEFEVPKITEKGLSETRDTNIRHRFTNCKTNSLAEGDLNRSTENADDLTGSRKISFDLNGESEMNEKNKQNDDEKEKVFIDEIAGTFNNLPKGFDKWSMEEQSSWINVNLKMTKGAIPETLQSLVVGVFRPGDCGRSPLDKPDWLDMDKFRRGQQFAVQKFFGVFFGNMIGLYHLFSFEDGLKPIIFTNKSHTPYLSFKRYLSTARRLRNWYTSDPWEKDSPAYKDMQVARHYHQALRRDLENHSNEDISKMTSIGNPCCPMLNIIRNDFQSRCAEPVPGQCPYRYIQVLPNRPKGMNQGDMTSTQFAFVGPVILCPQNFGIHNVTDEDLEAFCHTWKALGYLLGIEDEFNFCRGSLDEIRQRTRDIMNFWVKPNFRVITPEWEHMMRCLTDGVEYYFPAISFEVGLVHAADILEVDLPQVYASLNYGSWFMLHMSRWFLRYVCKSARVVAFLNDRLNLALNYAANLSPKEEAQLQEKSAKQMEILRSASYSYN